MEVEPIYIALDRTAWRQESVESRRPVWSIVILVDDNIGIDVNVYKQC